MHEVQKLVLWAHGGRCIFPAPHVVRDAETSNYRRTHLVVREVIHTYLAPPIIYFHELGNREGSEARSHSDLGFAMTEANAFNDDVEDRDKN